MVHVKPETKTLTMACTINHFFSVLLPLRRQRSFLPRMFTNTGIRSSSSFSMFPPCIQADRIVYPSLHSVSSSRVGCDWTPPLRVSCVMKYIKSFWNRCDYYNSSKAGCCPRLVVMNLHGISVDSEKELNAFYIKEQHDEFSNEQQIITFFIRLLAEVLGSEKDARRKMYIMWCKLPFGFGAEVDEETANKLKALQDVLQVLPDYGSHVNRTMSDGLVISRSPLKDRNFSSVSYLPLFNY